MAEQAKIESRDSTALIRRITLAYFKWFVIFGILIMLLGLVPLLTHLMSEQRNRLVFETRAAASQVDVFLTRIQDISSQIASRTHVRLQLQKYNRGQLSLERYRVDTPAYLYDAISTNPLVLGLTQVDADGKDVLSIGKTVDKSLWPDGAWSTEQSLVTGPFSTESGEVLVVFAPIVDDKNVRIGTCDNGHPNFQTYRLKDVPVFAICITQKGNERRTVGIILDALDLGRDTKLISAKIDDAIMFLVATPTMPERQSAIIIPPVDPVLRFQKRLVRLIGCDFLFVVDDRLESE